MRRSAASLEAGVKYLILGALSTGLLVYGMSWLYGMTGELSLSGIAYKLAHWEGNSAPILFAAGLMLQASPSRWVLSHSTSGFRTFTKVPPLRLRPSFRSAPRQPGSWC